MAAELADASLEHYYVLRLDARLGGGADGRVYRAIVRPGHREAGERHAVKIFRSTAHSPARELDILKRLQPHPHIVPVLGIFDSHEYGPRSAVAFPEMDFDLHVFLARRNRGLAMRLVVSLCGQMLRGMAHMHQQRIVHRDLKPANLLLRVGGAEGDDERMV